jgi:structural maintenance of chromosome 4
VLKELLAAQDKGLLSGIYGRLGDLGSINEKYDTAISSSCF